MADIIDFREALNEKRRADQRLRMGGNHADDASCFSLAQHKTLQSIRALFTEKGCKPFERLYKNGPDTGCVMEVMDDTRGLLIITFMRSHDGPPYAVDVNSQQVSSGPDFEKVWKTGANIALLPLRNI